MSSTFVIHLGLEMQRSIKQALAGDTKHEMAILQNESEVHVFFSSRVCKVYGELRWPVMHSLCLHLH